jgi:hypothetical protein
MAVVKPIPRVKPSRRPNFRRIATHAQRSGKTWIKTVAPHIPCPRLTTPVLVDLLAHAVEVTPDVAAVIVDTITRVLAYAIRGGRPCTIPGFGTFVTQRLRSTKYMCVRFTPSTDWWAAWLPVPAYNTDLRMVGIWDGADLLPFGHPDNPYANASEVPFFPDYKHLAATPLPGEPKPTPFPHPIRATKSRPLLTRRKRRRHTPTQ